MPPRPPLRHALLLGLVQGPTEVLPVSSSAHIALLPHLVGWSDAQLDVEQRNSMEVALHAGAAAALLIALRGELAQALYELDGRALATAVFALAPPALVGFLLERRLDRRPTSPGTLAASLGLGGAAMAWADARPRTRRLAEYGPRDGIALGLAQALALLPGVSRNGAVLTAARARRFARADAHALSWRVGLPVLAGAAALKACRLGRSRETLAFGQNPRFGQRSAPPDAVPALTAAAAAFLSTLACTPLIQPGRRGRALWPFAVYRAGLACVSVRTSARIHTMAPIVAATASTDGQAPIASASR